MKVNRDFLKGLAAGFVLSLFVIYSFFRLYWIMEVGLKYLRWHAILWLYLSIAGLFFGFSYWLYKGGKLKTDSAKKKYLVVLGVFMGWYVTEGFLRIANIGTTYTERREGVFVNPAERTQKTWYMIYNPLSVTTLSTPEYSYVRKANSEGFADKEWATQKDSGELRVITLGDSFTDGDGSPQDSSYPRELERLLQQSYPEIKINVMNAGRCGSDPWFEYKKLHDLLLKYKPDLVLYTNGSNDMFYDHLVYGGMERFAADSTVKNKIPHHRWLGLYEVSYVFRLVMNAVGYDETFFDRNARHKNEITALDNARALSRSYSQLAVQNNFKCIQLIRAEKSDIEDGHHDFNTDDLIRGTETLPNYSTFDILSYYKDSLHINSSNVYDYFWQTDGHHNVKGYHAMAQAVFSCVRKEAEKKVK
ncbi:MAG: GDSL-type esterase/lipase family protein [Bacteroidota bacterium]